MFSSAQKRIIWLSISISLLIIISSYLYAWNYLAKSRQEKISPRQAQQIYQSMTDGLLIGSANAPNSIVVYESLLCHACANFNLNQIPKIIDLYVKTGRARVTIYPMPPKETMKASLCAWQEGRLLSYEKYFFQHQKQFIKDKNSQEIIDFARKLKLDSFENCYRNKNSVYDKIIQNWLNQAKKNKIKYTPAIFINGKAIIYNGTDEVIDRIGEKIKK